MSIEQTNALTDAESARELARLFGKFLQHGYQTLVAADGEPSHRNLSPLQGAHRRGAADIRLPQTSGDEVFRRLKEENPAVKFVIASCYLAGDIKSNLAFAGVKRFVKTLRAQ